MQALQILAGFTICCVCLQLVESFEPWALYGYGYSMGQYFHVKYVVLYGMSTAIAKFQNIAVPNMPRCIGWVHLYSDMWKYFDPGLYSFLVRYCIYIIIYRVFNENFKLEIYGEIKIARFGSWHYNANSAIYTKVFSSAATSSFLITNRIPCIFSDFWILRLN